MDFKNFFRETMTIKLDKAFGLDIGDRSVEIIELDKVFKFSVVTYGRTDLPAGVVENGRILNQNVLAERIKKLLKEAKPQKVSTNKVIVSLPESQTFVLCFEVDAQLKSNSLLQTISDKASLSLPMNIDKTYWDFIEKPLADKKKKLIMFFSVPKDIANSYMKFCNSIGLEVVSLCMESLSLARILLKSSPRQSLIMDIGSQATNLNFFDSNDKINMSVTIPVAGEQMTQAIKEKLKIEPAEAEALKIKLGFRADKENTVRPVILPVLNDILKETKQAIDYYEETFKQKLEDIYIIGGSALLPAVAETIKANLKREVSLAGGAYSIINLNSLTGKNNSFPLFANVIGLGMLGASGEFKDMNLLKKMPGAEVNSVNRLNLFNMGYLSRVNTVRTIINNKYVLAILVVLIGIIFAVLLQQAQNYTSAGSSVVIKPVAVSKLSKIGTSTKSLSTAASSSSTTVKPNGK